MKGYVTGVESAKQYFPDQHFHAHAQNSSWPYFTDDATYRYVEEEIYRFMGNSYRRTVIKMDYNGRITLGGDVIRDNKDTRCSISLPKKDRKGRPNFIVIFINGKREPKKIDFTETQAVLLPDYKRFLRDAMCVNCQVSLNLLDRIREREAKERARLEEETLVREEPVMKEKIFRGLLAQLEAIPQGETPDLSKILFYGKYSKSKLTAETVKNA